MTDAPLRKALTEVFQGYEWIDFDWNGWRERARQALATPPVVAFDNDVFVRGLRAMADKAETDGNLDTTDALRALANGIDKEAQS